MKAEGLELLSEAKAKTGLPIVTEIMSIEHLPLFEDVDIIQVGARNMQNFELLKQLGRLKKPILLKRGLANTIEELLMSAEYIMAGGNEQVILCERGIRTYETFTRNTLDISAVPVLKRLSHLPVIVDPSHASGLHWLIEPLALSAAAIGADGLIIEGPQRPQPRPVRRGPVHHPRPVRRPGPEGVPGFRAGGRPVRCCHGDCHCGLGAYRGLFGQGAEAEHVPPGAGHGCGRGRAFGRLLLRGH